MVSVSKIVQEKSMVKSYYFINLLSVLLMNFLKIL